MPITPEQSYVKCAELAYKALIFGNTSLRFKIAAALNELREVQLRANANPPRATIEQADEAAHIATSKVQEILAEWGFPTQVTTQLTNAQAAKNFEDEFNYLSKVPEPLEGSYTGSSCDETTLQDAFHKLFS